MAENSSDSIADGSGNESLVFVGQVPASIKPVADIPGASTLVVINERNEHTLRSSLIPNEPVEVDDSDEITQHLKRQETKLDLLLDLVTELLSRQNQIPQDIELRLTAQGVDWSDTESQYSKDDCVEVKVYITPSVPRPLTFFGRVVADSQAGKHSVEFSGVSRPVTDLLEKILFRHHRRAVAQSRSER